MARSHSGGCFFFNLLGFFAEEEDEHERGTMVISSRQRRKLRFVQLYVSKSFESHRAELLNPTTASDTSEHVLSPRLVDAISATAEVVWANTKKREGLTGRSDVPLHTAVGMPVAMDANGNMCVVVMFSPNNIQSSDDALDFLRSLSHSACSPSIPCLVPAFDPIKTGMRVPEHRLLADSTMASLSAFGDGVDARFVSMEYHEPDGFETSMFGPESHGDHELAMAPKDTFGIPMLPSFAEIGNVTPDETLDVFDEASYGVWTTIMESCKEEAQGINHEYDITKDIPTTEIQRPYDGIDLSAMEEVRKERLTEFCNAFLGMSVFDLADVWVPAGPTHPDSLRMAMCIASSENNIYLHDFVRISQTRLIKYWTGAVGRAFSSGNPVWTANPKVYIDPSRVDAFNDAKIRTVLSVPVYSGKQPLPTCVVSFYSHVRTGSVPFVLRFVQQALRLLWDGLEVVKPHESVDERVWSEVSAFDLGEMAADVEMQHHFMSKKRPRSLSELIMSDESFPDSLSDDLTSQFRNVGFPDTDFDCKPSAPKTQLQVDNIQSHLVDALKSIRNAVPFDFVNTNAEGSKRAHVMGPIGTSRPAPLQMPQRLPSQVVTAKVFIVNPASSSPSPKSYSPMPSPSVFQPAPIMPLNHGQSQQYETFDNNRVDCNPIPFLEVPPVQPIPQPTVPEVAILPSLDGYCMPVMDSSSESSSRNGLKLCRIQGCTEPAITRRPHCVKHSGNRLCEYEGCGKCAQGSTRFCIAHGGGRRCTFPGCDKGARDKFFCAAHGGGKRCSHNGCTKSAVGGSKLCTAHGGGRRCSVEGCDKSAQSSTKFCVKHGGGKKCAQEGCEKVARGRTQFCAAHGGGIRCRLEGCNRVAIGKRQLCRAHGGGAGPRSGDGDGSSSEGDYQDGSSVQQQQQQQQLFYPEGVIPPANIPGLMFDFRTAM